LRVPYYIEARTPVGRPVLVIEPHHDDFALSASGTFLFAWRRTLPPFLIGGAEVTQQLLAEELAAAGWHVTYLGSHEAPWNGATQLPDMRAYLDRHRVPYDEADGTLRYRWNGVECVALMQNNVEHALGSLLGDLRPDVVFTSQEGSAQLAAQARPTALVVGILHSVSATGLGVLAGRPHYGLAVSDFVRSRAPHTPGTRLAVMYPPFALPGEGSGEGRTASVLMINPIPAKGSELLRARRQAVTFTRPCLPELRELGI